jgi:hypothetical protein
MTNFVFNVAKGNIANLCALPAATDSLIVVCLKTAGLESDALLKDYANLSLLLAGASDEATFTNYVRKTLTSVTVTVDNANDWVDISSAGWTFTTAGGADNTAVSKSLICYVPSTGAADTAILPMFGLDTVFTPDGTDQVFTVTPPGFGRAA